LTGVVPRVTGLSLARAEARLTRVKLKVKVVGGTTGTVTKQSLAAFTAVPPGGEIVLTVKP
jgi:beta-lactam-binding protein with PASTA domain